MFPVASDRLISARFLSTPRELWFSPIAQKDSAGPLDANIRAASTTSSAGVPQSS